MKKMKILRPVLIYSVISLLLQLCLHVSAVRAEQTVLAEESKPAVALKLIAKGFAKPVSFKFYPRRTKKLAVLQQDGLIKFFDRSTGEKTTLLDLSAVEEEPHKRKIIDIAYHPQFQLNRRFFVSYTSQGSFGMDFVLSEFLFKEGEEFSARNTEKELLRLRQPKVNQRGGALLFDNDGMLLVGISDGGGKHDPKGEAQNIQNLLGSLLRLNVDSAKTYVPPVDNPFVMTDQGKREIFAYGFRDLRSIVIDRENGEIFVGDRGERDYEEINLIEAGKNYGWPIFEGSQCLRMRLECANYRTVKPLLKYRHRVAKGILVGGTLRGKIFPPVWHGILIFTPSEKGEIWGLIRKGSKVSSIKLADEPIKISAFATDAVGNLYLSDFIKGQIFQLVPEGEFKP
jgi:glucose/arabinose dehydrogenase